MEQWNSKQTKFCSLFRKSKFLNSLNLNMYKKKYALDKIKLKYYWLFNVPIHYTWIKYVLYKKVISTNT